MDYSTELEEKLNEKAAKWKGLSTRNMFSGVAYLIHGNICLGIWQDKRFRRIHDGTQRYIRLG